MKYSGHRKLLCEFFFKIIKIKRTLTLYSCLKIPPRENWFQYLRRVYATAINFPSISTLTQSMFVFILLMIKLEEDIISWSRVLYSAVEKSQQEFCILHLLAAVLGPLVHSTRIAWPPLQPTAPQRAYTNLWKVSACEIAHLGSYHLGNSHLGSRPCENAFGKVPTTILTRSRMQQNGIGILQTGVGILKSGVEWNMYYQPGVGQCFRYPLTWSTLGQVFSNLEQNGVGIL